MKFDCTETPIGALHAEKLAESVLLYVFDIAFQASHLKTTVLIEQPSGPGGQPWKMS